VNPSDWISLGALAVAFASIVGASIVAPWMTARHAHSAEIRAVRKEIYSEAVRLMRARLQEVQKSLYSWPVHDEGPTEAEAAATTSRLLLYAPKAAWQPFEAFFSQYWSTPITVAAEQEMKRKLDESLDGMRRDVGTVPWLEQP
jgi:hypothetical protein